MILFWNQEIIFPYHLHQCSILLVKVLSFNAGSGHLTTVLEITRLEKGCDRNKITYFNTISTGRDSRSSLNCLQEASFSIMPAKTMIRSCCSFSLFESSPMCSTKMLQISIRSFTMAVSRSERSEKAGMLSFGSPLIRNKNNLIFSVFDLFWFSINWNEIKGDFLQGQALAERQN